MTSLCPPKAYVLLVIFYLQTRPVPVVPVLQDLTSPNKGGKGRTAGPIIEGNDCYFCDDLGYIESLGYGARTRNTESLGQLLVGFFGYLANGFSFRDSVISIRTGQVLQKSEKEWTAKQNSRRDRYWWCIEDPFELSHNLGRVVSLLFLLSHNLGRVVSLLFFSSLFFLLPRVS